MKSDNDYSEVYNQQNIKKKAVVYQEVEKVVDRETGEVVEAKEKQVIRRSQTPDFIMLFTKTSPMLANSKLTTAQSSILFNILTGNYIQQGNYLDLSSATRGEIEEKTKLSRNTINQSISSLTKKEIILRKKVGGSYRYFLNPFIFGKGNFQNIESLRYEVSLEYDFNKLELHERNKTATTYEEANELLETPHKVVSNTETIQEDTGVVHQVIEVEEDKENPNQGQLPLFEEENTSNNDIEYIREQNRAKELSIKELELKIKAKELGIE